jgi:glycosyltransferase involved in cell wall biosynthesis
MIELEENSTVYNYQKSYGLERVKHFSWNDTAANLLKLYQQVGGEK